MLVLLPCKPSDIFYRLGQHAGDSGCCFRVPPDSFRRHSFPEQGTESYLHGVYYDSRGLYRPRRQYSTDYRQLDSWAVSDGQHSYLGGPRVFPCGWNVPHYPERCDQRAGRGNPLLYHGWFNPDRIACRHLQPRHALRHASLSSIQSHHQCDCYRDGVLQLGCCERCLCDCTASGNTYLLASSWNLHFRTNSNDLDNYTKPDHSLYDGRNNANLDQPYLRWPYHCVGVGDGQGNCYRVGILDKSSRNGGFRNQSAQCGSSDIFARCRDIPDSTICGSGNYHFRRRDLHQDWQCSIGNRSWDM